MAKRKSVLSGLPALLALALALGGCAHSAGQAAKPEPVRSTAVSKAANSPQPIPDETVVYKQTPSRELHLHIFRPDRSAFPGPRPAVLFFHGGGWENGKPSQFFDQAAHLATRGLVAIAAEYRLATVDGTSPADALRDAGSAIRYLRANRARLNIDGDRIAAAGGSAGGHLAAALASVDDFDDPADDLAMSKRPNALVLFNPVIDNGPGGYGHARVREYWERFSPLHNIREGHPPTIILLGTRDELIPVATGEAYCARVRDVGSKCVLRLFPGEKHAFFNRKANPDVRRETFEAQDAFLQSIGYIAGD